MLTTRDVSGATERLKGRRLGRSLPVHRIKFKVNFVVCKFFLLVHRVTCSIFDFSPREKNDIPKTDCIIESFPYN